MPYSIDEFLQPHRRRERWFLFAVTVGGITLFGVLFYLLAVSE